MAGTFKRTYRNRKGRPVECDKYVVECKIGEGYQRVPGYRDRKASEELGRKIEWLAALREAGEQPNVALSKWLQGLPDKLRDRPAKFGLLSGPAVAATKPLADHLDEYRQSLLNGVASSRQKGPAIQKPADLVTYRVGAMLTVIGAKFLSDVTIESAGRYLAGRRVKGLSAASSNHDVTRAKSFFNWMVRAGRATRNPLNGMGKIQVTAKARTFVRRALETDEGATLLRVTRAGRDCYGMTGEERYWLYRLAFETALRSSELRALTPASFRLHEPEPTVCLPGDVTKNREPAELSLRAKTARELPAFLATKEPKAQVFAMPIVTDVAYMFRHDLGVAKIAYETDSGRVGFHALRTTCLSWPAAAGVPLKTLQTFARHSTPVLTMSLYARTLHGSMADAAKRLPDLSQTGREALRATGTDAAKPGDDVTDRSTDRKTDRNGARGGSPTCATIRDSASDSRDGKRAKDPTKHVKNQRTRVNRNAREWMGIEPTKRCGYNASTALKAVDGDSQGVESQGVTDSGDSDWRTHWRKALQNNPDLRAVVTAWPTLSDAVRAGILAMVRASSTGDG